MASRIMHLALSYQLERIIFPKNVNNFRIGCILPDAVISGDKKQANTHFIVNFEKEGKYYKYFDFYGFYEQFKDEFLEESLYLGYYFHLIQDNLFRTLLYRDLGMLKMRGNSEFLKTLYEDYGILNRILVNKYDLKYNLIVPENFSDYKINEIYKFEIKEFIQDMSGEFIKIQTKSLKIFTEEIVDKYFEQCTTACANEYQSLKQGKHCFSKTQLAFEINSPN